MANNQQEGETGVVELATAPDGADSSGVYDDPEIVKLMIEYFYLFDYGVQLSDATPDQDHASPSTTSKSYLVEHAKVFAMSVKYQADGLRELAAAKFKDAVTTQGHWDHEDFPTAISIIYTSTTDDVLELRLTVEDVLHDHFDALKAKEEFAAVTRGTPGLLYSLLGRRPRGCCDKKGCAFTAMTRCRGCQKNMRYCKDCFEVTGWVRCPSCGLGSNVI